MVLLRLSFALLLALAPLSARAQAPAAEQRPGFGVDAHGNQVIDPTKNVLDLVLAAVKRLDDLMGAALQRQDDLRKAEATLQNGLREAETRRYGDLRDADTRRLNELREAETRRINELQAQKQIFDLELARVIRAGLDASTLLLATQLKEVKTDASDRMAKLEQFANEQRGRASAGGESVALLISIAMGLISIGALVVGFLNMRHRADIQAKGSK